MTSIRPASTADASAIARIHVAGWQSAYRDILPDEHLDSLPQARYWQQVRNGMWMRAALFASIFGVDTPIRDHYQAYYTF